MKKVVFIVFMNILGGFLAAQNVSTFSKLYTIIPGMRCQSDKINICSGGYIIYGGTIDSNNLSEVVMLKIDTLGNLLWKKSYGKSGYNYYDESIIPGGGGGVPVPWAGYIEPGSITTSTGSWYKSALYRFDDNGDTLWTKIYNDSTNELGITANVTREKQYIVGGEWALYDSLSGFKFFTTTLKKTDTLGNIIWQKTYHGYPGHARESLSLDTCKDDGYIIAAFDVDTNYEYYCGSGSIFIMKTDSTGTPQWSQYINDPICAVYPTYILSLHDGSYLAGGAYDDSIAFGGENQYGKVYLVKISSTGAIQWAKQYGGDVLSSTGASIKELPNGDIVVCGIDSSYVGCILKIDSNGNQKWLRYYEMQSPAEQDYLIDIQPTADGGYVSAGLTYGSTQNIWVVKTDSLGCDTIDCNYATGINEVKESGDGVMVYPNPNKGIFTVSCHSEQSEESLPIIKMYDILGEQVLAEVLRFAQGDNSIDISNQPNGIYLYRVISYNGNLLGEGKLVIQK